MLQMGIDDLFEHFKAVGTLGPALQDCRVSRAYIEIAYKLSKHIFWPDFNHNLPILTVQVLKWFQSILLLLFADSPADPAAPAPVSCRVKCVHPPPVLLFYVIS